MAVSMQAAQVAARAVAPATRRARAQAQAPSGRRDALQLLAGAAALVAAPKEAEAAYGQSARVFASKITNDTGFQLYSGDDFSLLIPSPMNPSKEEPYPNVELRYEDNFDLVSVVEVVANPTTKSSMKDFGSVSDFLKTMQEDGFFGEQTWYGSTKSEGGFTANTVSVVNVISLDKTEKDGKEYYKYHLLTRTADGDEGGRHLLISATVGGGKVWLCKAVAGDKRFFKGEDKFVEGTWDSFTVSA
jgi:hypothetical protein